MGDPWPAGTQFFVNPQRKSNQVSIVRSHGQLLGLLSLNRRRRAFNFCWRDRNSVIFLEDLVRGTWQSVDPDQVVGLDDPTCCSTNWVTVVPAASAK